MCIGIGSVQAFLVEWELVKYVTQVPILLFVCYIYVRAFKMNLYAPFKINFVHVI